MQVLCGVHLFPAWCLDNLLSTDSGRPKTRGPKDERFQRQQAGQGSATSKPATLESKSGVVCLRPETESGSIVLQ